MRVGSGFDVHRFAAPENRRPLMLMGIHVPFGRGLAGHSDADVMIHALMDALLGAAGLGDIGQHFPDSDAAFKDSDSARLLELVMGQLRSRGWRVENADVCLIG
ncbi:MAG: 2-C-methyl-D-erythritol 2,4-cyclodiphosphate synthase, partial [Acidobacteriota bacterium]|nr:2-C-methyl-D-erythritol 2,4-cyclodiphosphate synthase [Acidobacteriota bacterium]